VYVAAEEDDKVSEDDDEEDEAAGRSGCGGPSLMIELFEERNRVLAPDSLFGSVGDKY